MIAFFVSSIGLLKLKIKKKNLGNYNSEFRV